MDTTYEELREPPPAYAEIAGEPELVRAPSYHSLYEAPKASATATSPVTAEKKPHWKPQLPAAIASSAHHAPRPLGSSSKSHDIPVIGGLFKHMHKVNEALYANKIARAITANDGPHLEQALREHAKDVEEKVVRSYLLYALAIERVDMAAILVRYTGAVTQLVLIKATGIGKRGDASLHIVARMHDPAAMRRIVPILLDAGADINMRNSAGDTPVCVATRAYNIPALRLLVASNADVNALGSDLSGSREAAIHIACRMSQGEECETMIRELVNLGADVNLQAGPSRTKPHMQHPALHIAAAVENITAVGMLLDAGANIDKPLSDGETALHAVVRSGSVESAEYLLRRGAKFDFGKAPKMSLLLIAMGAGNVRMLRCLLENGVPANVWYEIEAGNSDSAPTEMTVLHRAAIAPELQEAIELLLDQAHVDVDPVDSKGYTPLYLAVATNNIAAARTLLQHGADINLPQGEDRCRHVVHAGMTTMPSLPMLTLFVQFDANLNALDWRSRTLMLQAFEDGSYSTNEHYVKLLLQGGSDLNARTRLGQTPLHLMSARAKKSGSPEVKAVIDLLLQAGADRNIKDDLGNVAYEG